MIRTIVSTLALLAALAAPAQAGLLFNQDGRAHEVTFERGKGRVTTSVAANKTVLFECSEPPCSIRLEETGQTLRLTSNSQDVVIRDGKLATRGSTASAD